MEDDLFDQLFGTPSQSVQSAPTKVGKPGDMEHEIEWLEAIEDFEDKAWSPSAGGLKSGWKDLDDALEGFQTGWIMVGGASNVGKTSFVSALGWRIADNNPDDAFVLDVSLDDPMSHKLPRTVASANMVLINAVRNPNAYIQFPQMIQRRTDGITKLKAAKDRYRAIDSTFVEPTTGKPVSDIDALDALVQRYKIALLEESKLRGLPEPRKLVLLVDNFYDLTTSAPEAQHSENARYDYLAVRIDQISQQHECCIITTGEFRKLNGFRRPQVDDLRQTIKVVYKAKAILLVHNDVSLRGEAASIYYERAGNSAKQSILEIKIGKNKFTSNKGTLFFEMYPECAYFDPAPEDDSKRYLQMIYSD
jgi:replicative DNA helicase